MRDTTLVAEGFTRLACVDPSHKLLRIPEEIRPLTQAKAMGTMEAGKTQHYLDLAKEIYK